MAAVHAAGPAVRSSADRSEYRRATSLSGGHPHATWWLRRDRGHMQHGGFDAIEALAHLRETFTCFLPKCADLAFQTVLDIDQQIFDTVHLSPSTIVPETPTPR